MAYFKIGTADFSQYISELKISTSHNYNSQTNAAGDTVVDYINKKRVIEVSFIPLSDIALVAAITNLIDRFNFTISYRNPRTNAIEEMCSKRKKA